MASSCSEQRQNLLACLADSPCVAAGRTLKECMEVEDGGCKGLRVAYFTCKRGQLDMRKRIKGNLYFQGEPGTEAEKQDPGAPPPR